MFKKLLKNKVKMYYSELDKFLRNVFILPSTLSG